MPLEITMDYQVIIFVDSAGFGGIESHIIELAKLLRLNHVQCSVLFYKDHNNHYFYEKLDCHQIKYQHLSGSFFSTLSELATLSKYTAVHTHGYKAGIIARLCCRILNIKCVSTYHAGETGTGRVKWYNKIDKTLSFLSRNFAVSKSIASQIDQAIILDNFVIPKINAKVTATHCACLNVGFVGRLSYEKGPDRFVKLVSHFADDTRFNWHIFGEGPMQTTLNFPEQLVFHGMVDSEHIWSKLDILIVTSRQEGLPMAILEAMANKVLVISTDVGAISNVVINHQTGYLLESFSITKVTEILNELIQKPNYQTLTSNAQKLIQSEFSGDKQWLLLDKTYRSCVSH